MTFEPPMVGGPAGRRLDFCLVWGAQCGQPAADAYCQKQGWEKASAWEPAQRVGPTTILSGEQPCDDPSCDGFASITCSGKLAQSGAPTPAGTQP